MLGKFSHLQNFITECKYFYIQLYDLNVIVTIKLLSIERGKSMLGLAVMFIGFIYLIILCFATIKAYCAARRNKLSRKAAAVWGLVGFLVVFLPVFWDLIPNKVMYNYYCKNEAGFFQYKTIEQWKAENPGVWETLKPYSREEIEKMKENKQYYKHMTIEDSDYFSQPINQRISVYTLSGGKEMGFGIKKNAKFLYDEKTKEVIAKSFVFRSGPGNVLELGGKGYKIWLNQEPCGGVFAMTGVAIQFVNDSLKKKGLKYDY